jgi:ComF family protein
MKIYSLFHPLLSVFLPNNCILCTTPLAYGRLIVCKECFASIPKLETGLISALRQEIPDARFRNLFIPFQFSPSFQLLIHQLKYRRLLKLGEYFGRELAACIHPCRYDVITAVPLHTIRQRERGYNQSAVIAKSLAAFSSMKYSDKLIKRVANNRSQTTLNRMERRKNVEHIFTSSYVLDQMNILIVDDVVTTGSTLNACCRVLRQNGAANVDAAALATPATYLQRENERKLLILNVLEEIPE